MPKPDGEESLVVINALSELPRVARWIRTWAACNRVPPDSADRLDLCSTELLTNIVSHAYDDAARHLITLTLRRDGEVLRLDIEDDGRPFDPRAFEPARLPTTLDDAAVGGWGVAIVRGVSDGLQYERAGGRNRCTVLQRCAEPP